MIINYIMEMIPYMISALIILVIFRIVKHFKAGTSSSDTNWKREIGIALLFIVLSGLFAKTIFQGILFIDGQLKFLYKFSGKCNFIPFTTLNIKSGSVKLDIIGNIVIFIPIGLLLPLLWKPFRKLWWTVGLCFLISLFIETVQLFLPRSTDINDLIFNMLGGFLGYLAYLLIQNFAGRKKV